MPSTAILSSTCCRLSANRKNDPILRDIVRGGIFEQIAQFLLKTRAVPASDVHLAGRRVVLKENPATPYTGDFNQEFALRFLTRLCRAKVDIRNGALEAVAKGSDQRAKFPRVAKPGTIVKGHSLEIVEDQPTICKHLA
ncbi:MAG: hypothetical protein WBW83_14705 [Terriglobales bacterium]